tara:strand:- start:62 stop:1039 length:978 start_codon:yes stop_codon:yes gene_type:complete
MTKKYNYGEAILSGFEYLLENYPEVFVIGQGLWSPWYVGNTMKDLDSNFGKERIIDTPVSESAVTGMAVGASLCGSLPIVVHPRIDFMLYAMDSIVNQAAKWSHMTGGQSHPSVTIRGIINRGGEQGAQHSQSLHSWFAHVPGLRVLMPSTVKDARDMLISAVLCKDPVVYIDDRWLYDQVDDLMPIEEKDINEFKPSVIHHGSDITLVGSSYSTKKALEVSEELLKVGISAEVVDIRALNPFEPSEIIESVRKTRRLVTIDGSWKNSGFSAEILASVYESLSTELLSKPLRITLADCAAPTSRSLEEIYYPSTKSILDNVLRLF